MKKYLFFLTAVALTLMLGACGEIKPPKRGPINTSLPITPSGHMVLTASTNCADPNTVVVFTLDLINRETFPITFDGTPPVDIILRNGTGQEAHWSTASDYPADFQAVLPAGETRTYQWTWTATFKGIITAYVPVVVSSPDSAEPGASELRLQLGVGETLWRIGDSPTVIECSALQ